MVSEVACNLGINANMLSRWKSEMEQPAEAREAEAGTGALIHRYVSFMPTDAREAEAGTGGN